MVIILLGPPGVGKGTQAKMLVDATAMRHISTGDLLRAARKEGTELGKQAQDFMDAGELVPDSLIMDMVAEELDRMDPAQGIVFDGFPRTIPQAEGLAAIGVDVDKVVEIAVDDEEIVKRMSGRRVHLASGRTYHVLFNPPKVADTDDATGEPLVQRDDDQEETVRNRLAVYHEQTKPLIDFYSSRADESPKLAYIKVNGVGSVESIRDTILERLE